ncbi:MAG: NADH-quinone oxidoreductase subunit N [Nitrospiraceae bacterium]|nr:MAG: NADH-quinone oxidoreductase subunit N [Nitrospiraceae bacterium]
METASTITLAGFRLIIPELTIICVALMLLLLDLIVKKKGVIAAVGIAGTFVALYGTFKLYGISEPVTAFSDMFVLDGYGNFFKVIFYLNVILTICISLKYMTVEKASFGEYYALLLFATAGMMFMASAADLIVIYLGLELMALSTYILAGLMRKQLRSNEAALKYFFLGAFSSAFLLYGISLTYGLTGTTNLKEIAASLITLNLAENPIVFLGLIFLVVSFGFKIALVPFHMWAPDVYEGAPTSITAFMSVGPKAAGFAVMGRVLFDAFGGQQVQWNSILIPLAVITMAAGSIIALAQTNIKRMLAYSSIAHAGYMLLGIIAGTPGGLTSTVNYLMIYTFMNIGAFAIIIMLRREGFQGENLEDYMGLAKSHPLASALMLIFMFSLTGIPPTAGFVGKFYVFLEAINSGYVYLAVIAVIFSAISAFFYLRVVMYMYMKDPKQEVVLTTSYSMNFALAVTAVMVLLIGVFPSFLLNLVRVSILG